MAIALGALAVFFWSLKSGQFEDIEGPKYRMLFDDEEETFLKNKNEEREKKGAN